MMSLKKSTLLLTFWCSRHRTLSNCLEADSALLLTYCVGYVTIKHPSVQCLTYILFQSYDTMKFCIKKIQPLTHYLLIKCSVISWKKLWSLTHKLVDIMMRYNQTACSKKSFYILLVIHWDWPTSSINMQQWHVTHSLLSTGHHIRYDFF